MFLSLLVLSGAALAQPVERLTLRRAIDRALSNSSNPDLQIAQEAERIAAAQHAQGRSALLPSLQATTVGQNQTRNLVAQGIRFDESLGGLTIPESVGPFNTLDLRMAATQPVLDFSAIRRLRASSARTAAAGADFERRRDEIAAQVARAYIRVLRDDGALAACGESLARAQDTLASVRNRHDAGSGIGIDVLRAEHQVATEKQQRAALQGDREQAVLTLLDALGLPFDTRLELEDRLRWVESSADSVDAALRTRSDLAAQKKREESVRLDAQAQRLEALPTVAAYADAGMLGRRETHTIGLMVRFPVFDGGRRKAREAESDALARQEAARASKLARNVELQVRQSQVALQTAAEQVRLADSYAALAQAEWEHTRRRHEVGITGVLELIEAQTRLAAAERNRIEALYRYTEARIEAGQAAGAIREMSI